ncbi:hypothetical protein C8Q76DRAFT_608959 [Earliella scabrosa]|nr:hypothetical protein C8Q76DRAFT_608959 [Earliella scabrosa]
MHQFLYRWAARAQKAVLEREAGPRYPVSCEDCSCTLTNAERVYRCFDCFDPALQCQSCAVRSHRRNPFHRFDEWDPTLGFWSRRSLGELPDEPRLVLNLGHSGGDPCPLGGANASRPLVVVHSHGVHKFNVRFCRCTDPATRDQVPPPLQLIRAGLWPGSWERPETAYTIAGLRDHQLLAMQSQISTHDFVNYLVRLTNNVCPEDLQDRYREFLTASREFSFTRATKRAGVEPGSSLPAGCLATLCPSCPQPGINMDPIYEHSGRPDGEQYIDALHYTCDGNFQQTQKIKPMDANDYPLTLNGSYYSNERDFETFRKSRPRATQDPTTCHKFGAMGYSRYGGRVTGIVGLTCARHMFALRLGAVDMDTGESFDYIDWVHCSGLRWYIKLFLLISGYDINCQYRIKFDQRMRTIREKFGGLDSVPTSPLPRTIAAVGKFHLPAHIPSCRFKFSYNFLPGAAMTDGEANERMWPVMNGLASRTKEMGPGMRHDTINDVYGDINIRRVHNTPRDLCERHRNAMKQQPIAEAHFKKIEAKFSQEEIDDMRATEKRFLADVVDMSKHKTLKNPYELKIERGLSTKELLAETAKTQASEGGVDPGLAVLDAVYEGVELQSIRDNLLDAIEDDDQSDESKEKIADARDAFLRRLSVWSTTYNSVIQPALETAAQEVTNEHTSAPQALPSTFPLRAHAEPRPDITAKTTRAEHGLPPLRVPTSPKKPMWHEIYAIQILLPSAFDARILHKDVVKPIAAWEKRVREGRANDALNELRTNIITSEMLKLKKMDSTGKAASTRMGKKIQRKHGEVESAAEDYRRTWTALLALGVSEDDPLFRPLRKQDVVKFPMTSNRDNIGNSRKAVSWIWEDMSFGEREDDEQYKDFYDDVRRVHWFRSSALVARWREEVNVLVEEMHRSVRFFGHFRRTWVRAAEDHDAKQEDADAAYARK